MLRSLVAVAVGFLVSGIASSACDFLAATLLPTIITPAGTDNVPVLLGVVGYTALALVLGGYIAALVARRGERGHALSVGVLALALGLFVTLAAMLGPPPTEHYPLWFGVSCLVLAVPAALLGGILRTWQKRQRTDTKARLP